MLVTDFDYHLPPERIAKHPPAERGSTRLLVLSRHTGAIEDSRYTDLANFLNPGDVLVLNDTRVIPARLYCTLPGNHPRELVVLERHGEAEPQRVMYRGRLRVGDVLHVLSTGLGTNIDSYDHLNFAAKYHRKITLTTSETITVTKILGGGLAEVESATSLTALADKYGTVPLPPYLHRPATASDRERYQTVWAAQAGSAAAPTASLNMTENLLARLTDQGIQIHHLTLHVGLGTFLPIRSKQVEDHHMHSEWYHIPSSTLDAIAAARAKRHRVIALGTTVARTLEHYARTKQPSGEDDIFIYPGFQFQLVDALLTNFHAPRSTVLMLAAAFAGWNHLSNAYSHAIENKYNFLSYGDSMLIC